MDAKKGVEPNFVSLEDQHSQSFRNIDKEEVTIEDLHKDLESKLHEQGFVFNKKRFYFEEKHKTGFWDKMADKMAAYGGSWGFILFFIVFITAWMVINTHFMLNRGFDPYPYILLNFVLSCIAAVQAPMIMMSQNRQTEKERRQEEINIENEILDFKQDRLDLIIDQKQWKLMKEMNERLIAIEKKMHILTKHALKKSSKPVKGKKTRRPKRKK